MNTFISQTTSKLIKNFVLVFFLLSCNDATSRFKDYPKGEITLPSGQKLKVYIANTHERQKLGLSGLKPSEFEADETMLFTSKHSKLRQFWMPETFFNLDIIFLNEDLYVLDIHRNLSHFTEAEPKHKIPLSKKVFCNHVLEIKADSPFAKEIKVGMMLKWTGPISLEQIVQDTHL